MGISTNILHRDKLVAFWDADDMVGSFINDKTNNGTLYRPVTPIFEEKGIGKGIIMDPATNNVVSSFDSNLFSFTDNVSNIPFTIIMDINIRNTNNTTSKNYFLSKGWHASGYEYLTGAKDDGTLVFEMYDAGATTQTHTTESGMFIHGETIRLGISFDGVGTVNFNVNGRSCPILSVVGSNKLMHITQNFFWPTSLGTLMQYSLDCTFYRMLVYKDCCFTPKELQLMSNQKKK